MQPECRDGAIYSRTATPKRVQPSAAALNILRLSMHLLELFSVKTQISVTFFFAGLDAVLLEGRLLGTS